MPALVIQVITGAWMACSIQPDVAAWFKFASPPATLILS
ncbi:hypothetical protein SAMN06265795_10349 [Noviherbaspirillum humi]|uniref:Uncharacterized protein n=1 Tax=Noviherbaspirillum humi TaxID=1688639 RepID=A0A239EVX0_9BURK|nr:hypothetical protein SAMN06265795_10349 [Noviherbaspirillum humi]